MRWFSLALMIMSVGSAANAQTTGYDAVIQKTVAEVRGGQSGVYPITVTLRQGTRVHVVREELGWLAISPPDGSTSWVMERVLDQQPIAGRRTPPLAILADNTDIMLGSSDRSPQPCVINKVNRGTMVVVVGEKAVSDISGEKTTWWRIQPTAGEVRWISKDSIGNYQTTTPSPTQSPPTMNISQPPLPDTWIRAELAERNGDIPQAISLYRQTANEQSRLGYTDLANRANNRAETLSRQQPATTTATARQVAPPPPLNTGIGNWPAGVLMTSGPGTLRRSAFQIDGQPAFVLEDSRGYPRIYVVAQPGLNLEPFVNRSVEMFGPITNRSELTNGGFMTVTKLHLLR